MSRMTTEMTAKGSARRHPEDRANRFRGATARMTTRHLRARSLPEGLGDVSPRGRFKAGEGRMVLRGRKGSVAQTGKATREAIRTCSSPRRGSRATDAGGSGRSARMAVRLVRRRGSGRVGRRGRRLPHLARSTNASCLFLFGERLVAPDGRRGHAMDDSDVVSHCVIRPRQSELTS